MNDINIIDEWSFAKEKAKQFIIKNQLSIIKEGPNSFVLMKDNSYVYDYWFWECEHFSQIKSRSFEELIEEIAYMIINKKNFFILKSIEQKFLFFKWKSNQYIKIN